MSRHTTSLIKEVPDMKRTKLSEEVSGSDFKKSFIKLGLFQEKGLDPLTGTGQLMSDLGGQPFCGRLLLFMIIIVWSE